ncbi:MAG: NAD(P)-dependent dehydrogenase (short-subunit alcohol dehydrogenase family) [Candidatus Promineifilaceae bacterium]|jgi:NAD(P)-dependent dehydrogenase (short-subunit alcohol dehydrogenase family)
MTFTRNAAFSLRTDHIRIYCLNIGWVATEQEHVIQTETGQPENWLDIADETMPFGRLARPNDIAPMVTFLLTEQASMMTGSVIDWNQKIVAGPYKK